MQWPAEFTPTFAPTTTLADHAICFAFIGEDLLIDAKNALASPGQLSTLGNPHSVFMFGQNSETPCVVAAWPKDTPPPPTLQAMNVRQVFDLLPPGYWGLAARAKQMLGWELSTRFCGACGHPTLPLSGEPAKQCPACGQRYYPQIAPAIMCLVRRGHELLLARSPHFRPGMYSALAGFVEAGESVEACVHREVFEETGIRVRNLRWFSSQPWPFPQSLMLAFHADYAGGEIVPQPGEIEDAQWFGLDRLPDLPAPVSIASRLIAAGILELRQDLSR